MTFKILGLIGLLLFFAVWYGINRVEDILSDYKRINDDKHLSRNAAR